MGSPLLLLAALALDALAGEPDPVWRRIRHPVRAMGDLIGWADERFNQGRRRRAKGAACALLGCALMAVAGAVVAVVPDMGLLEILVAAAILCQKSLVEHVRAVADGLRYGLPEGRAAVGRIVGRDVRQLDAAAVGRAAIESTAESFSDGVVAPAFWYLLLGLPGLLAYKFVNTADSMVGYRNERHGEFGWAAARLDDVMSFVPARIAALLIAAAASCWKAVSVARADAPKHRSPNAGWPEAALAAVLGVALAGPRTYSGVETDFAFVNPGGRLAVSPADIDRAIAALWRSWFAGCAVLAVLAVAWY